MADQWTNAFLQLDFEGVLSSLPSLNRVTNPEFRRDHTWLEWFNNGMGYGAIAKRWNDEHPDEPKVKRGTVKSRIEVAQREYNDLLRSSNLKAKPGLNPDWAYVAVSLNLGRLDAAWMFGLTPLVAYGPNAEWLGGKLPRPKGSLDPAVDGDVSPEQQQIAEATRALLGDGVVVNASAFNPDVDTLGTDFDTLGIESDAQGTETETL
jgi:hypothetical protein